MFLLDTNVCILAIAGIEPDASCVRQAIERSAVALSAITVAEFFANSSAAEAAAFEKLVGAFPALSIDESHARTAALYRAHSPRRVRIQLLDCLIAAQAKLYGYTLVTNNVSDFPMRDIVVVTPASAMKRG